MYAELSDDGSEDSDDEKRQSLMNRNGSNYKYSRDSSAGDSMYG